MSMIAGGTTGPSIGEVGEFALIDEIVSNGQRSDSSRTVIGPGDDGAVVAPRGNIVAATDAMVEGVHFRRDWSEPGDIGRKIVAVNVADLEAMGATPLGLMIALSAPGDLPVAWVRAFRDGVLEECRAAGIELIGGDTTASSVLTIVGSAIGDLEGRVPLTRSGAVPGQRVAVKGRLGWAAAGLRALSRGFRSPRVVVEAQRCPQVPYGAGREAAAAGATSLIDVSDGLLADLGHVATASGVSIALSTEAIEVADPLQAVASATGGNPLQLILTGGEDHALAGTFDTVPPGWIDYGVVTEAGEGGPQVLVDSEVPDWPAGHDHFAR